jgi:hypothetical protein
VSAGGGPGFGERAMASSLSVGCSAAGLALGALRGWLPAPPTTAGWVAGALTPPGVSFIASALVLPALRAQALRASGIEVRRSHMRVASTTHAPVRKRGDAVATDVRL